MTFFVGQMNDVKFNAMVAGDSGAGKTTFVQSFSTPFCSDAGEVSSSCTICFYEAPEYNEYVSVECNALELQDSIEKKHEEWIRFSTMLVTDAVR